MFKRILKKVVFALLAEFVEDYVSKKLPGILHRLAEEHPGLDEILLDVLEELRDEFKSV